MIINFIQQSATLQKLLFNHKSDLNEDNIFSYSSKELEQILGEAMLGDAFISASDIDYENGEFVFSLDSQEKNEDITEILKDFLQNDDIRNIVDADNNGTLGIDEINDFLEAVEALDGNSEDISMNDVFSAIQSINDGTFNNAKSAKTPEIEDEISSKKSANTNLNQNNTRGINNYNGNNGPGASTNQNNSSSPSSSSENINNMSLEQLETKRTEQESAVKTAQDKVQAAFSGESDAVKSAQSDCDAKKQAYEEALDNDEGVSEELRDSQQANQLNIDNQKITINDIKSNISDNENKITSQKSTITSDESNVNALKASISKLQSQTSDDEAVKADIASKLQAAQESLAAAEAKLEADKEELLNLENEKTQLEDNLKAEEDVLAEFEIERETIEANILANCGTETKAALEAFKQAELNVETIKTNEIEAAKAEQANAQSRLDEINAAINAQSSKGVEKEFAVNDLGNVEELYKSMGLEEKGLNFEVFASSIEGYNNLEDKGNGYLGIFDTTQGDNANRYYLLDLNEFKLVGQSQLKTGSGNMDNIDTANQQNSHATLSGFERVGSEYYSDSMGKRALRLIGLEKGINDNALAKGTVVHYTTNNHTWGCKGFPPVITNGNVDTNATYELMRELFPENAIIYTHPTDQRYWEKSELYA